MRKKRLWILSIVMVFMLVFAGCGQTGEKVEDTQDSKGTEAETSSETDENQGDLSNLKVGFSDMLIDEISTGIQNTFKAYWESQGCETIVLAADGNADEQLQTVEDLISQQVDILVMRPISDDIAVTAANQCEAAGVQFFALDMADDAVPENTALNVTFLNHYGYGVTQAEYLIKQLEADPDLIINLCYIWHPNTIIAAAQARNSGLLDTLQPYIEEGRVVYLDEQSTEGDTANATGFTENWLTRFPEMNCIVAGNDATAVVVCAAIEAAGGNFEDYYILGIDGDSAAFGYISDGKLDMTASINFDDAITADCEVILRKLSGEELSGTYDTNLETFEITKDNLADYE